MTKALTFFLILLAPVFSQSQTFTTENPQWAFRHTVFCVGGNVFLSFVGDTLLLGKECKIMEKRYELYDNCLQQTKSYLGEASYLFEEQGVVYLYRSDSIKTGFDTLYNFNLGVGGQYQVHSPSFSSSPRMATATVLAKGSSPSRPTFSHWQIVKYEFPNTYSYTDTVYENIGNVGQYFFPWDAYFQQVDGHEGGEFTCYRNDLAEFSPPGLNCGALITDLEKEVKHSSAKILFHPTQSLLSIDFDQFVLGDWLIYDLQGQKVGQSKQRNTFDISHLPNGFYVIKLKLQLDTQKQVPYLKIFKQ